MSGRIDGRLWRRVKRRDRSEGAASEVRKVAVTPEVERAALVALRGRKVIGYARTEPLPPAEAKR